LTPSKPEFTQEILSQLISAKTPKVDTLVAQAQKAFDQLKKTKGIFVDIITGKELLELTCLGLRKKSTLLLKNNRVRISDCRK